MAMKNDGKVLFTTEKASQSAKSEYSNMLFRTMEAFAGSLVTNVTGYGDHRPDMYVLFLINMIVDDDTRERMKEERKQKILKIKEQYSKDVLSRDKAIFEVNMDYFGECLGVYDKWIGVIKKQVILEVDGSGNITIPCEAEI